jgi:hypothetical protein
VYFNFYPVWSTYSQKNLHGAKGSDKLTFIASGLRPFFPASYLCSFLAADGRNMNSTLVTASSVISLSCFAPEWGLVFVETNTTVRIIEVHSDRDDKKVIETLYGVQRDYSSFGSTFRNNYEFYQIYLKISHFPNSWSKSSSSLDYDDRMSEEVEYPNGGSSKGLETVQIEGRGFHTESSEYIAIFSRGSSEEIQSGIGFFTPDTVYMNFTSPQWGITHS